MRTHISSPVVIGFVTSDANLYNTRHASPVHDNLLIQLEINFILIKS